MIVFSFFKIQSSAAVDIPLERISILAFLASHVKSNLTLSSQLRIVHTIWKFYVFQ